MESCGSVFPHRPSAPLREQVRRVPEQIAGDQREDDPHTDVSRETAEPLLRQPLKRTSPAHQLRNSGCARTDRRARPRRWAFVGIIHPCNCSATRGKLVAGGVCGDRRDRPRGRRDGGSGLQLCRCDGARSALEGRPVRSFDVCDGSSLCSAHGWWDALLSSSFVGLTASGGGRSVPWSSTGGMPAGGTGRERR